MEYARRQWLMSAAGLGEQMVTRPVARLNALKNLVYNSRLFASLPKASPAKFPQTRKHKGRLVEVMKRPGLRVNREAFGDRAGGDNLGSTSKAGWEIWFCRQMRSGDASRRHKGKS